MSRQEQQPLTGFRVLDLSGPMGVYCGKLMADMGADVVKVEPPGGEPHRRNRSVVPGESKLFQCFNRGKRGIVVDKNMRTAAANIFAVGPTRATA
ncbi:MAG: CoA transferase [Candidatus Hydrogenedentes bacterium]|nr:CoA transferase [Candidatus Hydrogenedentota bacterium]